MLLTNLKALKIIYQNISFLSLYFTNKLHVSLIEWNIFESIYKSIWQCRYIVLENIADYAVYPAKK